MKKEEMKVKFPKKINFLCRTFEIIRDKEIMGYFSFKDADNQNKPVICISSDEHNEMEAFMHEALELSLELMRVRYERPDENENYVFYFSHKELDAVAKLMAQAITQLIEVNKRK